MPAVSHTPACYKGMDKMPLVWLQTILTSPPTSATTALFISFFFWAENMLYLGVDIEQHILPHVGKG